MTVSRTQAFLTRSAIGLAMLAWLVVPFLIAGTLRWWAEWRYLATLALVLAVHRLYVHRRNPRLRAARGEIHPDTPGWDLAWNAVFWWLMAAAPMVAAAERRLMHRPLPIWTYPVGTVVFVVGLAISAAAMAVNPFFEGTVHLQAGQHVVDTGPYAWIRHPGYLGLCLWALTTPLLLRSPAAFVVAVLTIGWVVLRTALEDRLLRHGLPGYPTYAARVRWRLLPGLW